MPRKARARETSTVTPSQAVEPPAPPSESAHVRYLRERWEGIKDDIQRNRDKDWDPVRLHEAERAAAQELRAALDEEEAARTGETELQRARRLLRYATEAGSMGAAATLEKRVSTMERAAHDAEEERRRRAPDGDRLAMLIEAVLSLPLDMRTQVEAAIRDQRPGLH